MKVEAHVLACVVKLQGFYSVGATAFSELKVGEVQPSALHFMKLKNHINAAEVFYCVLGLSPVLS